MLSQNTFEFLNELKQNNNREWFAAHKARFDTENKAAKAFFGDMLTQLQTIDNVEAMQVFRIYRDVRFSKDKIPYKTHFSASYIRAKPLLRGGMYIHIEDAESFVAGGFWEPNSDDLLRIRKELECNASPLRAIIAAADFQKYFQEIKGDELKTAPKSFDKLHPDIDLIRKKQYLLIRKFSNKEVLAADFQEQLKLTFSAMRPFFDYMSEVLTTDLNGEFLY